ncbi:MAG: hypothetical protein M3280_12245 [Actinomycetota bacterium]|nr:hypothetical protein [Actinomycetota bacterium]
MQVAEGMHVEWVDDEAVVLDTESSRLHYLNAPAALVYAMILEYGYAEAVRRIRELPSETDISAELPVLLEDMVEKGLLVDA